ncbi:unnamed protein product [Somion occarium]|uniref:DNA mismatch repair protein MutL n=1 Tax=Somion occarium TaxID=3059160 RepID=A0ABP1CPB1_9APHY
MNSAIKAIDATSIHRISSGQVVTDLPTAVKELVENSLDAGATNIEVRFKDYGLESIEVIDNGSGIAEEDYDAVALKHHTSKLETFEDLSSVTTFGFRGEALSSICALSDSVTITTATSSTAPMGAILQLDRNGRVTSHSGKVARQRGTTVTISKLFKPLPVRRKELERNAKREYSKVLNMLNAYALVPCATENKGVRLTCSNQLSGRKTIAFRTDGSPSIRASVSALWGAKSLDNIVELDLAFEVETEKSVIRRQAILGDTSSQIHSVHVRGLVSKFAVGGGRTGTDRQFFYVNGRPCTPTKVQKAFNEIYRTFNANQSPFIIANFIIPKDCLDINVSPDKRTIFIHSENNLIQALKASLEETFSPSRSTFNLNQTQASQKDSFIKHTKSKETPLFFQDHDDDEPTQDSPLGEKGPVGTFGLPDLLVNSSSLSTPTTSQSITNALESGIPETQASQETVEDVDMRGEEPSQSTDLIFPSVTDFAPAAARGTALPDDVDLRIEEDLTLVTKDKTVQGSSAISTTETHQSPLLEDNFCHSLPASRSVRPAGSTSPDLTSKMTPEPVQMVLSTTDASWNLRRRTEETSDRPAKRHKTNHASHSRNQSNAEANRMGDLRKHLLGFARTGSQIGVEDEENVRRAHGTSESPTVEGDGFDHEVQENSEHMHGERHANNPLDDHDSIQAEMDSDFNMDEEARHPEPREFDKPIIDITDDDTVESRSHNSQGTSSSAAQDSAIRLPEVIRTAKGNDISMNLDLSHRSASWRELEDRLASSHVVPDEGDPEDRDILSKGAGIQNDDDNARDALSRIIEKSDFLSMAIIGQFNKGFIIARRRKEGSTGRLVMDDLFIIDQHAADEKYNFEQLQESTRIESQKLIRPEDIELAASDELLAIDNIEVLRQNGFEIEVNEAAAEEYSHRLRLVAKPVSKATEFNMKDLEELIHLMHDQPQGRMVRCSKARAMFASRACRKSVMIGHSLQLPHLTSIVRHMGTMSQPWNCPHGRPTMRHLSDILPVGGSPGTSRSVRRRIVDFDTLDIGLDV